MGSQGHCRNICITKLKNWSWYKQCDCIVQETHKKENIDSSMFWTGCTIAELLGGKWTDSIKIIGSSFSLFPLSVQMLLIFQDFTDLTKWTSWQQANCIVVCVTVHYLCTKSTFLCIFSFKSVASICVILGQCECLYYIILYHIDYWGHNLTAGCGWQQAANMFLSASF